MVKYCLISTSQRKSHWYLILKSKLTFDTILLFRSCTKCLSRRSLSRLESPSDGGRRRLGCIWRIQGGQSNTKTHPTGTNQPRLTGEDNMQSKSLRALLFCAITMCVTDNVGGGLGKTHWVTAEVLHSCEPWTQLFTGTHPPGAPSAP